MGNKNKKPKVKNKSTKLTNTKEKIINHIQNFENNFGIKLIKDFFEESDFKTLFDNEYKKTEHIVLKNEKKSILLEINDSILLYYEYIVNNYTYNSEDREELKEMLPKFLNLLCNIVYLMPDLNQNYLQEDWIKMHMKLMNICCNFETPEQLYILMDNKHNIYELEYLLTLFCLCLSKDNNFNQRIYLLLKFPDFLYQILIISASIINACCCGHGYYKNYNNNQCSCTKSIYLIYETFNYIEKNNKNMLKEVKKVKLKYLKYLVERLGKNIGVVILLQMAKMCSTYDIFNYLINETDLMNKSLNKDDDVFNHCVEKFEQFMHFCKEPEFLFRILSFISPPKRGLKKRIFYEIVKIMNDLVDNIDVDMLEKSVYKSEIFDKILDTLKLDVYLGDYLGIWNNLLNHENEKIIKIFSRNTYNIGSIFLNQIDNLTKNKLYGFRLISVIQIMNLFLKIGETVKIKYNKKNDYIEQLRQVYERIKSITLEENDKTILEYIEEFNKYFED